jgi:hypothetical protein
MASEVHPAGSSVFRYHRLAGWPTAGLALSLLVSSTFAQCKQEVMTADYKVCVPGGWNVIDRNDRDDSVRMCSSKDWHECGYLPSAVPGPGVVFLIIVPSDRGYGIYESREEILRKARITGRPPPDISDVPLKHLGDGLDLQCWVARRLIFGDVWADVYTLTVGGRRFRISVLYNNEPANIESFRAATRLVLSSITPTGGTAR